MAKPTPEFPKRLVESDGAPARLVRAALEEPLRGPSEAASFRRLSHRPSRNRLAWGCAFGLSVAGASLFVGWLRGAEPDVPRLSAEVPSVRRTPAPPRAAVTSAAPAASSQVRGAQPERAPKPKPEARAPEPPTDPARCAGDAREGRYDAAIECYDRVAAGHSMAAELALYEKARLQSKALGRGAAALETLEQHGRRFPNGLLAAEVGITRIELLIRLADGDAALAAIDRALGGSLGRERGGDLHALRADLLSARGDCDGARTALDAARRAGVHASRLEAGEKRCPSVEPAREPSAASGEAADAK